MTTPVYEWPREWYVYVVTQKYRVRSMSQVANRPWTGGRNVKGPHAQAWLAEVTLAPVQDPDRQDIDAFLGRLAGQSGLMRFADASRLAPWYDRHAALQADGVFSDGKGFSDGTGFATGYLPPEVYVSTAAARGSNSIVLGGFPVSTASVIRRGDLFQVKPSGVADSVPSLYESMFSCSSDASGRVGIEISPRLRTAVAVGDPVSLRYASTVFRLLDDTQGEMQMTGAGIGNAGFSLVEALDMVP
jgi:hypothetical protein